MESNANTVVRREDTNRRKIIMSEFLFRNTNFSDHSTLITSRVTIIVVKVSIAILIPFSVKSHGNGSIAIGSIARRVYKQHL